MKKLLISLSGVAACIGVMILVFSTITSQAHASVSGVATREADVAKWRDATAQFETWLSSRGLQPAANASTEFQSDEDNWVWREGGATEISGIGARTMESCVIYQGDLPGIEQATISVTKGSRSMKGNPVDPAFYWVIVGANGTPHDREAWDQLRKQIRTIAQEGQFSTTEK